MPTSPILRRKSLAVDAGSPPSEIDNNHFTLCKRTGRSHANLLAVASLVGGIYPDFLASLGYDPNIDTTRNLDNGYWRILCNYIESCLKELERIMDDNYLVSQEEVKRKLAEFLKWPLDFMEFFFANKTSIQESMDAIRPELALMCEMHMIKLIAEGSESMIKWYLPRAVPGRYHLSNSPVEKPPENIRILYGSDDE